jgi:hypothetical protein
MQKATAIAMACLRMAAVCSLCCRTQIKRGGLLKRLIFSYAYWRKLWYIKRGAPPENVRVCAGCWATSFCDPSPAIANFVCSHQLQVPVEMNVEL